MRPGALALANSVLKDSCPYIDAPMALRYKQERLVVSWLFHLDAHVRARIFNRDELITHIPTRCSMVVTHIFRLEIGYTIENSRKKSITACFNLGFREG